MNPTHSQNFPSMIPVAISRSSVRPPAPVLSYLIPSLQWSYSDFRLQTTPMNAGVLQRVRNLLAAHPATRDKSEIELPYRTDFYWCGKIEPKERALSSDPPLELHT